MPGMFIRCIKIVCTVSGSKDYIYIIYIIPEYVSCVFMQSLQYIMSLFDANAYDMHLLYCTN